MHYLQGLISIYFATKVCENAIHVEFNRFLSSCKEYGALITKDFCHISKNSRSCVEIMQNLHEKEIMTYSLVTGCFME